MQVRRFKKGEDRFFQMLLKYFVPVRCCITHFVAFLTTRNIFCLFGLLPLLPSLQCGRVDSRSLHADFRKTGPGSCMVHVLKRRTQADAATPQSDSAKDKKKKKKKKNKKKKDVAEEAAEEPPEDRIKKKKKQKKKTAEEEPPKKHKKKRALEALGEAPESARKKAKKKKK